MNDMETLIAAWNENHWEFTLAFEGLSNEDLWRRAHPKLLSIGELAGHIGYWEAMAIGGHLPDEDPTKIKSPLFDKVFDYYTNEVDRPVVLTLSVEDVLDELKHIHDAVKLTISEVNPNFNLPTPGSDNFTWIQFAQYQVFHVAYHTGQAFSVRHLMGHSTNDN